MGIRHVDHDVAIVAVAIMEMDITEIVINQGTLGLNPLHELGVTHTVKGITHGINASVNLMVLVHHLMSMTPTELPFLEAGGAQIEEEGSLTQKVDSMRSHREL